MNAKLFRDKLIEAFQKKYGMHRELAPNIWEYYYAGACEANRLLTLVAKPIRTDDSLLFALSDQDWNNYLAACQKDRRQVSLQGEYTEQHEVTFWKELGNKLGFDPTTVIWENASKHRISARVQKPEIKIVVVNKA